MENGLDVEGRLKVSQSFVLTWEEVSTGWVGSQVPKGGLSLVAQCVAGAGLATWADSKDYVIEQKRKSGRDQIEAEKIVSWTLRCWKEFRED